VNNSGQTLTYDNGGRINVKITGLHIDPSTGKVTYTQLADDDCGFGAGDTLADGAEVKTGEKDNTSNKFTALHVQLEIIHDAGAAANGRFDVYLDGGDASGELASDASGYDDAETNALDLIGTLVWHASAADDEQMRSAVFEVT